MESPSAINLQNSLARAATYLSQVQNIGESEDPSDLYYLVDFLVFLVTQAYPQIPCQAGCAQCCIDNGLPRTSELEWRHIARYLQETMPPETFARVMAQNEAWHRPQYATFEQEQARIAQPETQLPLPDFSCKQCPFLLENRCSIYPVRPAICRGFGAFTWRPGEGQAPQMFACQMAADTLQTSLAEAGISHAALPNWNAIGEKIYQLNQALSQGKMATLPWWLMENPPDQSFSILN